MSIRRQFYYRRCGSSCSEGMALPGREARLSALDIAVDDVLQIFLAAGSRLRLDVLLHHAVGDIFQRALAGQHRPAFSGAPAGVALLQWAGERLVLDHL